ncbi:MAG: YIP1 family protein [Promethearchaeota archaeon]
MVLSEITGTALLNRSAVERIESNERFSKWAWLFIIIQAIIDAIATYVGTGSSAPLNVIIRLVTLGFVSTLVLFFSIAIAGNLLGGKTSFGEILRVTGFILPVSWIIGIGFIFLPNLTIIWFVGVLYIICLYIYVLMVAIGKGALTAIISLILGSFIAIIIIIVVSTGLIILLP